MLNIAMKYSDKTQNIVLKQSFKKKTETNTKPKSK